MYVCIFVFVEVIKKDIMQNDYFHQEPPPSSSTMNTDSHPSANENIFSSNPTSHIDAAKVEEKEHDDDEDEDEKHIETEVDKTDDDKPLIQVFVPDDSSTFSFYEEFPYHDTQPAQHQQTHTNSHDSLLQADYHLLDTTNTAASSTDDLSTTTHQLSASVFHSKDSALGLSDDNLNLPSTNPFLIKDDDEEEDDDDDHPEHILLTSSSLQPVHDNQSKYRMILVSFFSFFFFFFVFKLQFDNLIELKMMCSTPHFQIRMMQSE